MKKFGLYLIIMALCFSFVSCGGDSAEDILKEAERDMEEAGEIMDAAEKWQEQSKNMDKIISDHKKQN